MFCQRLSWKICISGFALIFLLTTGCNAGPNPLASPTSTPDIPSIVSALSPVVSGQGVPDAAAYDPNKPGPHHVVLLATSGEAYNGCTYYDFSQDGNCITDDDWNNLLPSDWLPSSVSETELVALIGPEREINLGSQAYDIGPDITAYRYEVDMEIREARTGQTLATFTFTGSDPLPFPEKAPVYLDRLEGSHFHYTDLENWLCSTVTGQRCWIPLRTLQPAAMVNIEAFSPDGQILALGTYDGSVQLWQVSEGTLLRTLEENGSEVECVAFSPDGQILASGSHDGNVQLWQVSDGTLLRTLEGNPDFQRTSVAFSPDGQTLASASYDGSVQLWQVSDGTLLHNLDVNGSSVAFSPDLRVMASGSYDGTVRLWRVPNGTLRRTLKGDTEIINSLTFSPDGQTLASSPEGAPVQLWRVSNGTLLRTLEDSARSISFSPDGQTLAIGVRLWRISDGALLRTLLAFGSSVAFSPDRQTLAFIVVNDGSVRLWQLR